jgi:cysteine desulfurase / selenocysteine lyase
VGASDVTATSRNYLDHAATSWPKPEAVYAAMDHYAREIGAAAGRGDYRAAVAASQVVSGCRRGLMRLINAGKADEIAFFSNGTSALNAAIFGVVRSGDHIVTSAIEHNSVLRPLEELRARGEIRLDVINCDASGQVDIEQMLDRIDQQTALVALAHGSNVTGAVQDVAVIGEKTRNLNSLFLCDAAQTLGYLPIDVQTLGIDLLAAPGHKGACGPLGTGMLYVSPKATARLRPTVFGGTGSISESMQMPQRMPEMLEAGNLNVPALAGWNAGLEYLGSLDSSVATAARMALCEQMADRFSGIPGVFAIVGKQLPITSLVFDNLDPGMMGGLLDSEFGIDVRCGLHCSALVHESIRGASVARGFSASRYSGTLRLSAGHSTSLTQIDEAASAIHDLVVELSRTENS